MRIAIIAFTLMLSVASADMPLKSQALDGAEKEKLLRHAIETCDRSVVEVSGTSYEAPEGDAWEAVASVYTAPYKSAANLCKSHVCEYVASTPKSKTGRAPREFGWGKPKHTDGYSVWLSQNGECLGSPSSKIALINPIEEHTLRALIERRQTLAEQGRAWIRLSQPDARLLLDEVPGELELISVDDDFGIFRYRLVYGGVKGLTVRVSARDGNFVVDEAGPAPRP